MRRAQRAPCLLSERSFLLQVQGVDVHHEHNQYIFSPTQRYALARPLLRAATEYRGLRAGVCAGVGKAELA